MGNKHTSTFKLPIDTLPTEIVICILTFTSLRDILSFSLTNRQYHHLVHSNKDNMIWKTLVLSYTNSTLGEDEVKYTIETIGSVIHPPQQKGTCCAASYFDLLQEICSTLRFDSSMRIDDQHVQFTRSNLSAKSMRDANSANSWETIRTAKPIVGVRSWKIRCDKIEKSLGNSWWLIIGVETGAFPLQLQNHRTDVIGYDSKKHHYGCGLIVGTGEISHGGKRKMYYDQTIQTNEIHEGDWLGITCNTSDLTISFFHNKQCICEIPLADSKSQHYRFNVLYPHVSLTKQSQVTIGYWNGDPSTL